MNKNNEINAENTSSTLEKRKKTTSANYTAAISAMALALVIIINMLAGSLNVNVRTIDLTKGDVFTLTEDSEKFLENLDKDVTIYQILEDTSNGNADLSRLLDKYKAASSHIKVQVINPALNPTFLDDREYVSEGSIMVEYKDRYRGIELSDMITTSEDSTTGNTYYYYDMEGQITSAISYVISEDIPKAYMLKGAALDTLDASMVNEIKKQNIDVETLELTAEEGIPDDADIIIIDQPAEDISKEYYDMLVEFMDKGGSLIMFQYYNIKKDTDMTNVNRLMEKYGISVGYGVAVETNSSYMYNSKAYFGKPLLEKHDITNDLIDKNTELLVAMGDAINIGEVDNRITVQPLLTSTINAYYKNVNYKDSGASTSMSQLTSDPVGKFNYAVAITDDVSDKIQSKFVYISSYSFAENDLFKETIGTANSEFVVKCMQWLANQEETISIPIKNRTYTNLVYTVSAQRTILYIVVAAIPAAVLGYGIYVWFRRRKR